MQSQICTGWGLGVVPSESLQIAQNNAPAPPPLRDTQGLWSQSRPLNPPGAEEVFPPREGRSCGMRGGGVPRWRERRVTVLSHTELGMGWGLASCHPCAQTGRCSQRGWCSSVTTLKFLIVFERGALCGLGKQRPKEEGQDQGHYLQLTLCEPGQVPSPLWASVSPHGRQGGQVHGECEGLRTGVRVRGQE